LAEIFGTSQVIRRKFVVGAVSTGCVIANGFLVVGANRAAELSPGSPPTAGEHGITVDLTIDPNHIKYTSDDGASDPSNLQVNHNDIGTWKVKTHGPKHNLALIFASSWRIVISPKIPQDSLSCYDSLMRNLAVLFIHFIAVLARLLGPGGVRSLVAESLLLKHQILILNRSRKRSPNLHASDRILVSGGVKTP
jgi:hypothetical protein